MDSHPIQGGVEILLVASCYRNHNIFQYSSKFMHGIELHSIVLLLLPEISVTGLVSHLAPMQALSLFYQHVCSQKDCVVHVHN